MVLGLKHGHCHRNAPEDKEKIMELNLFKTTCPGMVESAAEIVEEMLK